jgi:hypothetical protein
MHIRAGARFAIVLGLLQPRLHLHVTVVGIVVVTWICPSGTHGLVYRVRPIMEVDWNKDSKIDLETKKEGSNPYSTRTFVELTLVNWRRTWGSRRLDFVIRAGSFNFFRRQYQQILRLPTATTRSLQQNSSSTSAIIYIVKIFTASSSKIVEFVQIDGSWDELHTSRLGGSTSTLPCRLRSRARS